ncbi:MAG: hypothetical protein ACYC69_17605 [Thermodesulfovibrionales bacterium]
MKMDEGGLKMMSMHMDMAAGTGDPKVKLTIEENCLKNGLWTVLLMNILN